MTLRRQVFLLLLTASLAACVDQRGWFERFIPKEADSFAREFLDAVRLGRFDVFDAMTDASQKTEFTNDLFEPIQEYLDHGDPLSIETVGVNTVAEGDRTRYVLTYEIQFTQSWLLAEIVVDRVGDRLSVLGLHVEDMPASLSQTNAFAFRNKSLGQYVFFVFQLLVFAFSICVVVVVLKSRIRRKWLWVILALVGFCQLSLNWSTGEIYSRPIDIRIPVAGAMKAGPYAPWFLYLDVPVGAIIFLARRKKLRSKYIEKKSGRDAREHLPNEDPKEPASPTQPPPTTR